MTRGLNPNYNRVVKDVFKGAATAAAARRGPLQDWYAGLLARGLAPELARVTLARSWRPSRCACGRRESGTIRRS